MEPVAWLVTTFPNQAWSTYAEESLYALGKLLPQQIKLCIGLDDGTLLESVNKCLQQALCDSAVKEDAHGATASPAASLTNRANYTVKAGWQPAHHAFVMGNQARDHASDYRLQATRFAHKIFVLHFFLEQAQQAVTPPQYLIWWDADGILQRHVPWAEWQTLLPGAGEAVSYLGRQDWDHSECGFMAFTLPGAKQILDFMLAYYTQGLVFSLPQWHDSYLFDVARQGVAARNLSAGVPGNNVWAATPLGRFSEHRKGHAAKQRRKALTDAELFSKTGE